jgi:hypothetical protein
MRLVKPNIEKERLLSVPRSVQPIDRFVDNDLTRVPPDLADRLTVADKVLRIPVTRSRVIRCRKPVIEAMITVTKTSTSSFQSVIARRRNRDYQPRAQHRNCRVVQLTCSIETKRTIRQNVRAASQILKKWHRSLFKPTGNANMSN